MGHDAGLVIGRTPAIETAVALDGDKRFGLPQRQVPGRLDVVVGVEQDGRLPSAAARRATTAGPPGVPSSLLQRRIRTSSIPAARTSSATASALRSSGSGSKLGQAIPGSLTRSFSCATVVSNASCTVRRRASTSIPSNPALIFCGVPAGDEVMAKTLPVSVTTGNTRNRPPVPTVPPWPEPCDT